MESETEEEVDEDGSGQEDKAGMFKMHIRSHLKTQLQMKSKAEKQY